MAESTTKAKYAEALGSMVAARGTPSRSAVYGGGAASPPTPSSSRRHAYGSLDARPLTRAPSTGALPHSPSAVSSAPSPTVAAASERCGCPGAHGGSLSGKSAKPVE